MILIIQYFFDSLFLTRLFDCLLNSLKEFIHVFDETYERRVLLLKVLDLLRLTRIDYLLLQVSPCDDIE